MLRCSLFITFFRRFYLFIHKRHREGGIDIGRGRSRLPAGNPVWDSIPGPWDHALSRRQISTAEPPRHPQNQSILNKCVMGCYEMHLSTGNVKNVNTI